MIKKGELSALALPSPNSSFYTGPNHARGRLVGWSQGRTCRTQEDQDAQRCSSLAGGGLLFYLCIRVHIYLPVEN